MTVLEDLKSLYQKCYTQGALASQILYVIRLQNEIDQMDSQSFDSYEISIFERAMHVFVQHFMEQMEFILTLDTNSGLQGRELVIQKHMLIEDIQEAVGKIVEIYQSMVGSIKNVAQPIFPTMSKNMHVFDSSPKMITAYSRLLNKMLELLRCDEQYTFLLYPTMTDVVYTDVLLKERNKEGKVIVVTFPEKLVEHPGVIPILFHEAFHVAERKIRKRKLRARSYFENMITGMEEWVFNGAKIPIELATMAEWEQIKDNLIDKWFSGVWDEFTEWLRHLQETDRILYAQNLSGKINEMLQSVLKELDTKIYEDFESELTALLKQKNEKYDFENYRSMSDKIWESTDIIKANIIIIFMNNLLSRIGEEHIYLYREGYADIAACLFLCLSVSDYDAAFELSCQFQVPEKDYVDYERVIRQYVVSEALGDATGKPEWKKKADELLREIQNWQFATEVDGDVAFSDEYDIMPGKAILESYMEYFRDVARALFSHFKQIHQIDEFRDDVRKIMTLSADRMSEVFLGE